MRFKECELLEEVLTAATDALYGDAERPDLESLHTCLDSVQRQKAILKNAALCSRKNYLDYLKKQEGEIQ